MAVILGSITARLIGLFALITPLVSVLTYVLPQLGVGTVTPPKNLLGAVLIGAFYLFAALIFLVPSLTRRTLRTCITPDAAFFRKTFLTVIVFLILRNGVQLFPELAGPLSKLGAMLLGIGACLLFVFWCVAFVFPGSYARRNAAIYYRRKLDREGLEGFAGTETRYMLEAAEPERYRGLRNATLGLSLTIILLTIFRRLIDFVPSKEQVAFAQTMHWPTWALIAIPPTLVALLRARRGRKITATLATALVLGLIGHTAARDSGAGLCRAFTARSSRASPRQSASLW